MYYEEYQEKQMREGVRQQVAELLCSGAVSYAEVARQVGVSRERVRQIKHKMHLLPSVAAIRYHLEQKCIDCSVHISCGASRCHPCAAQWRYKELQPIIVSCLICGKQIRRSPSARIKGGPVYCHDRHEVVVACSMCGKRMVRLRRNQVSYMTLPHCNRCRVTKSRKRKEVS